MHTRTHTHVYKRIHIHIHIHMHIHKYIQFCTHTHIYIYTHTHTKMYKCTHASTPGTTARQQTREELMQTQGALHISFVRRNQTTFSTSNARTSLYPLPETPIPPNPHLLFPTYPKTVRRPRASAILLFHTDPMNRVHSSEEVPRSFTMAPCVVVKRLEGKQRCNRARCHCYYLNMCVRLTMVKHTVIRPCNDYCHISQFWDLLV